MLKASKGSVVNIASVNGMHVFGHPAYSVAKAGLLHFTRLVAVEYGKFGIRSNAVAPGTVKTQAWKPVRAPIPTFSRKHAAGIRCSGSSIRKMLPMPWPSSPVPVPPLSPASACLSTAASRQAVPSSRGPSPNRNTTDIQMPA